MPPQLVNDSLVPMARWWKWQVWHSSAAALRAFQKRRCWSLWNLFSTWHLHSQHHKELSTHALCTTTSCYIFLLLGRLCSFIWFVKKKNLRPGKPSNTGNPWACYATTELPKTSVKMHSEHHTDYPAAWEHLTLGLPMTASTDVLQDKAEAVLSSKNSIIFKCYRKETW